MSTVLPPLLTGLVAVLVAVTLGWLVNLGAYFFSDRIVLRMHGAQEVSPDHAPALHRRVDELARRAQIPKPRVCVMPGEQPNAFATGRTPQHGVAWY